VCEWWNISSIDEYVLNEADISNMKKNLVITNVG
jgi:hypothetical protein